MSTIQWYPGHIAKAERELKEQLKRVDVVLEVLDARIPLASHHPQVPNWIGSKPHILVINRVDMIPESLQSQWLEWFKSQGYKPYFTNAQSGDGIKDLIREIKSAGKDMNQKRCDRGMLPRAVRAVVIGFPNVGKSALINRLLGRKVVDSARKAGVTRRLRWVRIAKDLELLDAPGVIPSKLENQEDAVKLAICEDIGDAAYDYQLVAAAYVDLLVELNYSQLLINRYELSPFALTGEQYLQTLSEQSFQGDQERAANQLLNDFRKGLIGKIPLEFPDSTSESNF